MGTSGYVYIDVLIIKETDKAFLVNVDGETMWLPKSQVADPDDYTVGDKCEIGITEWIANQKGL
jgi:hypothetical protein